MELKNKKGFITIYVMLAMMFFVVFVVTASVTASRKIKLQTESNAALYDIYNQDIDHIVQEVNTIPIYTQAQFLQIVDWIYDIKISNNTSKPLEYMYINNVAYTLDSSKVDTYQFQLKTNLYFKGIENTSTDEISSIYPYIPEREKIHTVFLNNYFNDNNFYKNEHHIYLIVDEDEYEYKPSVIQITNGEEFLKIGTNAWVNGVCYLPTMTYEIQNNIEITAVDYEKAGIDNFENRPEFTGILDGKDKIVEGLKITVKNNCDSAGFFKSNTGTIKELTLTKVSTDINADIKNFGIIAGINNANGKINNCNIMLSNKQTKSEKMIIDGNGKTIENFGILVGTNNGEISKYEEKDTNIIQGFKIQNVVLTNLGVVAGNNTGTISNTNLLKCEIIGANITGTNIGLIAGRNSNIINNIEIDDCIMDSIKAGDNGYIGGITGTNSGNIQDIAIQNNLDINVNQGKYIGGVAGQTSNTISKVIINGNLSLNINDTVIGSSSNDKSTDSWVGGITGKSNSTISKIKVDTNNTKACINININPNNTNYGHAKYVGGVVAENNGIVENCIISGNINDTNNKVNGWHTTGGIAGKSVGTNEKTIRYCYVNMKIEHCNFKDTLGTGGIVGVTGWNESVGINNIYNCAYVNEINSSTTPIVANGNNCGVGGIVGENWGGNSSTNNILNIENCYMNGKILDDPRSGAIIGINSSDNSSYTSTVNFNILYNKAYRWLGYASKIGTNVTLNYTSIAKETSDLDTLSDELKEEIEARIAGNLKYRYIKIELIEKQNNTTESILQMSDWGFYKEDGTRFYIPSNLNNITAKAANGDDRTGINATNDERVHLLFDLNANGTENTSTKYCVNVGTDLRSNPCIVTIDLGEGNTINLGEYIKYKYNIANDSFNTRHPITWKVSFSNDKTNYITFDYREKQTLNTAQYGIAGTWGL